MASEVKLSFFEKMFLDQQRRKEVLFDHARMNLTLLTFYSAFMLFVAEKMRPATDVQGSLFLCSALLMVLAFALSLWATQISSYEALFEPREIAIQMTRKQVSDEDFMHDRIYDYVVAHGRNKSVNDKKANMLFFSRFFLLCGLALHFSFFVTALLWEVS